MGQSCAHAHPQQGQRLLPGCAAFHTAPMTTHHAQPEPHQRPKERRHDGVPPQRPGEGPEQELKSDPVGVLDDEDQQDPRRRRVSEASPRHSVCARPAVAHPAELSSRPPHVPVDGRSQQHRLPSGRGGCFGGGRGPQAQRGHEHGHDRPISALVRTRMTIPGRPWGWANRPPSTFPSARLCSDLDSAVGLPITVAGVSARRRRRPRWRCCRSRGGSRVEPRAGRCRLRRSRGRGGCGGPARSPPM